MEKTLIIVRHGNTFAPGQTPRRVGCRTDIPLVEESKSRNAARYLIYKGIVPDRVFAAPLQRTLQTANLIIDEMKLNAAVVPDSSFTEIDYGDDENATEAQVLRRLGVEYAKKHNLSDVGDNEIMEYGAAVIDLWNAKAIVPTGWNVDVEKIIASWTNFSNNVVADNETALICTSNGIIRFAPHILNNAEEFIANHDLKVATGSVSIFKTVANVWTCVEWNTKP